MSIGSGAAVTALWSMEVAVDWPRLGKCTKSSECFEKAVNRSLEPGPPALGGRSLTHWTIREGPAQHFFKSIYFNWKLITLQYCSGFCHTLIWIGHGCTCVPHPESPSHFPPYPIPQGLPSAPALSTLPHASNLDWRSISHIHVSMLFSQVIPPSPSSKESKSLFFFNLCVSFAFLHIESSLPSF